METACRTIVITGASGGIGRATAVLFAADHPGRREYWVGGSTVATLVANAAVPGLLDRYLARTGFDSQQEDRRRRATDPDNLFELVDARRDFGAHGRFDDRARGWTGASRFARCW
ncbi:hypothetical protein [Kitasatospora sp. NPDC057738]|uniref:hypothetical protein n=1 Tax=unclassified Kitasatospora TaxID=2633591 RepID=UPI00336DE93A